MTKINEILKLDLKEDIKNVIDLEDYSEIEIQQEIESYIVTDGLGQHLYSFLTQFTSNIKETGVWLSGFYGSGKSYFGKMLGYIIGNPIINGTPARQRFLPRLKGVTDESLIENSIRKLDAFNSRVIFLDVAKQNTDRGLAFTLFSNLLKTLGLRDDQYGYMEFDLLIDGKFDEFKEIVKKEEGKDWNEIKKTNRLVAKVMRKAYSEMGFSEADYTDTQEVYNAAIKDFSASKFKNELEKYLTHNPGETLVFIFDEASEAISQRKFTLLDLEGISEALSAISSKVWTIAIAQEKLDDVINNANVNRSQLTKVTDRFKTKVHLESTEVDVIIRSHLLQKKDFWYKDLIEYHRKNEGLIADATNLKSSFPTKTSNADDFAAYYPFHRYQFDILQKFLFSSNALVATQIAARGMIITTFDVLRRHMQDEALYAFTPGHSICTEAQTAPPIGLVNKYDTARKILRERSSAISGEKLLKTIHLLADSEVVFPTVENITKSYISDISLYYGLKPAIEEALHLLVEAKVLLLSNNNYKITSDLEGKLLEEMKIDVELFSKKRTLITCVKNYKIFGPVAAFNDGAETFKFSVLSDQDDELSGPGNKQLKLVAYNIFNVSENRLDFVEQIKLDTQYQKDLITLIPDNSEFPLIDKLIIEISRYHFIEEKYSNESDPAKRQIIRDFSIIREEKEKELRAKIEHAYRNASLLYMFDEYLLDTDNFKGTISDTQRKVVKNIYTKRLRSQLSEGLVPKIFSCRKESLSAVFSGDDFKFFDNHGNFVGDNLKVVEELTAIIKNRYADGKTLESDFSGAPWGYSFGTIVSTLAALFRAGRISVKYNGDTWLSFDQKAIHEAFTNTTKFKTASFKSITATLTAAQKNQAVQLLIDLEAEIHTGKKIDWSINDFDLAESISAMAEHFIAALSSLKDTVEQFDALFPSVAEQKQILQPFGGKITEGNYIEKVEYFLSNSTQFSSSIQSILKAQKFIKKNFSQVKDFNRFIEDVLSELKKADRADMAISDAVNEFKRLFSQDMVKNLGGLQQQVQLVKDGYYKLMKTAESGMSHAYQLLEGKVDGAMRLLKQNYPESLNKHNRQKLEELKRYCTDRIKINLALEYSISCKNSSYSLSDLLNYTALAPAKENELLIIQASFISQESNPEPGSNGADEPTEKKKPRTVKLLISSKVMTVQKYKALLTNQLTLLAAAKPDEEIELEVESV
ncbi:MAG: BREX system P-loop protein BrxC [Candidatus Obscuribacterales bacterium]|nr:BREX system P-loop protein BrxC [Candidatus Obscuribacterales bacterium]